MKVSRTVRFGAVLLAAWLAAPSAAQGQDRVRPSRIVMRNQTPRARVGISMDVRQSRRFDDQGALVTDVLEGSPAWEAGIREGDVVTSFRGHVLTEPLEAALEEDFDERDALPVQRLLALAREMEPDEMVEIVYLNDGESHRVEVEAEDSDFRGAFSIGPRGFSTFFRSGDEDDEDARGGVVAFGAPNLEIFGNLMGDCPGGSSRFWSTGGGRGCVAGVELRELNPSLGEYFGTETGVLVIDVDEDNPLGLMPGDVILSVGDREVTSLDRLRRVLGSYEDDETVSLTVIRKGDEEVLRGTLH